MGKFTAGVAGINDKTTVVGVYFCMQSFVSCAMYYMNKLASISPYPMIWNDINWFLSMAVGIMNLVAIFMMACWGIDKRRFWFAASAFVSIVWSVGLSSIIGYIIENDTALNIVTTLIGMVPFILLIGDAIARNEPKILAIFLAVMVASNAIYLVYVAIGIDAYVVPQAVQPLLEIVTIQSYFISNLVRGFYLLAVTERGKQLFDKKRAAVVFMAFGAFLVVLSAVRILVSYYVYDGGRTLAYGLAFLAMGVFAVYAGIKAWTLRTRVLEMNVLYHVL